VYRNRYTVLYVYWIKLQSWKIAEQDEWKTILLGRHIGIVPILLEAIDSIEVSVAGASHNNPIISSMCYW
jgi:hypothetical protein